MSAPRAVHARLLVRELEGGATLASPVFLPDLASYGAESEAREEQAVFLREYVARVVPEQIALLSLPDRTELREVLVTLPGEALPRRLQREVSVAFACVVIPADPEVDAEGAAWVVVPALDHTFYVDAGEPLDDAMRVEVRRIVIAKGLSAWERLGLLPARSTTLETLEVPLPDAQRAEAGVAQRRNLAAEAKRQRAEGVLAEIGTRLHAPEHPPPLTARDAALTQLGALLTGKDRLSVALVGPEHTGKTALFEAWLATTGRAVYATSGAQLIAGMSGLGQWQERIFAVMEAAAELDAVLYFDNLADLLAERVDSGGADFAGAMRPWLDDGRVRLVGELRPEGLDDLEGRHWAFFANLSRIKLDPLTVAETRAALSARAAHDALREPHRPRVAAEALDPLVDLAARYLPYGAFPGKAVRLYQDLRAAHEHSRGEKGEPVVLGRRELYETFSLATGVPEMLLRDDAPLRVDEVAAKLSRRIIGQDRAVLALAETIGVVKAALQPANKPLAAFLFVGPTGVGKTELARALAELLFGSPERMVRFDMSELSGPDAADRLIGGSGGGLLTRRVREQPFCVLLLDEIEKAHPSVFDLLLQVTGEGRLTDARGRTAYFHNAIVIMTSNLGAAERRAPVGFTGEAASDDAYYERAARAAFRPELYARLDRIVAFRSLDRAEVRRVALLAIDRVRRRRGIEEAGGVLEVSEAALDRLAAGGYSEAYGARAMRRHVEERLVVPLARLLSALGGESKEMVADVTASGEAVPDREGVVAAGTEAQDLVFTVRRKKSARAAYDLAGFDAIAAARRDIDRSMSLPTIERIEEQISFLLAQIGDDAGKKKDDARRAREMGGLLAEHHRMKVILEELRAAQGELRAIEELAMAALFAGEAVVPVLEDARAAHALFRERLPYALAAPDRRDEITLILEELDQGAFDDWLVPMLHALPQRGWTMVMHIEGAPPAPFDDWPRGRRWGPPRDPDGILGTLAMAKRSMRCILLRCRGPYAGSFLALEAGLHRTTRAPKSKRGGEPERMHVFVKVASFAFAVPDDAWNEDTLAPPETTGAQLRKRAAPARERIGGEVILPGKRARVAVPPADYWARLDEIALEHLLLFERAEDGLDRSDVFGNAPDGGEAP